MMKFKENLIESQGVFGGLSQKKRGRTLKEENRNMMHNLLLSGGV